MTFEDYRKKSDKLIEKIDDIASELYEVFMKSPVSKNEKQEKYDEKVEKVIEELTRTYNNFMFH